jgi:eukaryotic-like serine/threonine-protein kinase
MRPQVGQVINNKYRLLRLIGDGGMGSVYEAHHEVLGTRFALKFLHPELSRRSGLVQRFLQEAKVSAQIQSPHVVRVTDVDQSANGLAFIVLEFLEGKTLQTLYEDLYKAGQRLSYADALEYAMQMIEGVEAAHKAGVVHRDLKPDNVMITTGPKGKPLVKLLDFGIAKLKVTGELERGLTRPGVIMGTPEYMAPEQAYSADAVDARADIFSLGVMLFEMLAGRRPVGGDDPQQIAAAYLSGQVARLGDLLPGVAPELAAAVHKAMAPLAKNRFASVSELRDAIEPFALAVRPAAPSRPSLPGTPTPTPASDPSASPAPSTNVGDEPPRAVPKTLPPEDEAPVAAAATNSPQPFAHSPSVDIPVYEGTPSGTTLNPASPALAVSGFGATEFAGPLPLPEARPGGTAVGAGFNGSARTATASGTPVFADLGGTAPMDPYEAAPRVSAPSPAPRRRQGRGSSMLVIVLLALGVSGAVVGGVYTAQHYAKIEDHNDTPKIAVTPPASVHSDPPLPSTISIPTAPPPPTTAAKPPPAPPGPVTPRPHPSGSAQPQVPPTGPLPPMIPSSLPFPFPSFPFPVPFGPPGGTQPQQPPQQQPPQQQPPGTPTTPPGQPAPSGTHTRPRIIIVPSQVR